MKNKPANNITIFIIIPPVSPDSFRVSYLNLPGSRFFMLDCKKRARRL
ncbi:MAG: hypothetical protein LKK50_02380 [Prevotella sp.]|nr:hypothetical protein [Prevotella sp.]MCH4017606.1 hypothetical protein [Prevotella sp.]MCI1324473.1 hypothetical protein [Prevotella sp.]MCI1349260.1 hypothetical protein [Prevotella sp.]MCI1415312.1 hypothetical protein [Prevotella sp.]MCI1449819.1 hypothetical protein [Prevotella sp.]